MNKGFFRRASLDGESEKIEMKAADSKASSAAPAPKSASVMLDPELSKLLAETVKLLSADGMEKFAQEVNSFVSQLKSKRFTVAVVGEFSRGKSTFVNRLFGKEIMPVGNLPTTAMLTRIRYGESERITVIDTVQKSKKTLPLNPSSWDGLIADMDGNDPSGVAFVELKSDWLKRGIEIIDTPGAGDLEAKRASVIGDALRGSDGAIIAISAEVAMSMSEKLFIEERLISKKTPFLMLIITKLDRIPERQRAKIIEFVKVKLKSWGMNIPVYVPYDVNIPGDDYSDIIGMDKVKNLIHTWIADPDRVRLTQEWIVAKTLNTVQSAVNVLREQNLLSGVDEAAREKLIKEKTSLLSDAKQKWKELREEMKEKSDDCYNTLTEKINEYIGTMTEKLQYEAAHNSNLQKWWKEDYPYKLKIEMTNLSVSLENNISRIIATDLKWFNSVMENTFKTHVLYSPESIADKSVYTNFKINSDVKVHDLSKAKNISRIGLSVLSIASYCACSSVGIPPIIGSTGIGTGGSIISESIFKNKIEAQRDVIRDEIAKSVPEVVKEAMTYSKGRIKNMYKDIIKESIKQEKLWIETQSEAIKAAKKQVGEGNASEIINKLKAHSEKFEKFLSD